MEITQTGIGDRDRALKYSKNSERQSITSGKYETDMHQLFHCYFARSREIWFTADIPLPTELLPPVEDGMQNTIILLLPPSDSVDLLLSLYQTMVHMECKK